MLIIGMVGMPKSGKNYIGDRLAPLLGTETIGLSKLLREKIFEETGDEKPTREVMFKKVLEYRRREGADVLAKLALKKIESLPKNNKMVVIDGFRRVEEMEAVLQSGHKSLFLGVIAHEDPETDRQIRLQRLQRNPDQRGKGYEDAAHFDEIDRFEWAGPDELGSRIGDCLARVSELEKEGVQGRIYVNRDFRPPREIMSEVMKIIIRANKEGQIPNKEKK